MSDNSIKTIANAAAAVIIATSVSAAEPDWKDAPELGDTDGDHCITISADGIESDGSVLEKFLVSVHEHTEDDWGETQAKRLAALFEKNASSKICLEPTPPGITGEFHKPDTIVLNEDYFRYSYEQLQGIPYGWILNNTYNHEQEHQLQHLQTDEQNLDMSDWSSSDFIQWRFAEEMVATYAGKLASGEAIPNHRNIDMIFEEWLDQNGTDLYPCLAHTAGFPNNSNNLTAVDLMPTIGEHVPQHEHIRSLFSDSTTIRARMETLADNYVLQNPTPKPAAECYPPKPDGEYNLDPDQKSEILWANVNRSNIEFQSE